VNSTGAEATVAGFAAVHDAAFLTAAGIPAIGYGPGDLRDAHGVDEHVAVEELMTATRTYAALAAAWCGGRPPAGPRKGAAMEQGRGWTLARAEADAGAPTVDLTAPLGCEHMELAETQLAPGAAEARPARDDVEQVLYVVEGRIALEAGGERAEGGPHDALLLPTGTAYALRAIGAEPARVVTIGAPLDGHRGPDALRQVAWDDLPDNARHAPPDGYRHPWATFEPYRSRDYDGHLGHARQSFVANRMEPGQSGQHHRHAAAEEVHYLLYGACRMRVGDTVLDVRAHEAVRVAPELFRSFSNESGAPCAWLVIGAPVDEFVEPGFVAYLAANDWSRVPAGES
jgi:mannose-6-phosphate isomerase-like protein (cupin superfamily)